MSKKDDYEIVLVTEDEARTDPNRRGKWKIMKRGNGQLNGDFPSKKTAGEYLEKRFPDSEPEIESEPEEESSPSPWERS